MEFVAIRLIRWRLVPHSTRATAEWSQAVTCVAEARTPFPQPPSEEVNWVFFVSFLC